MTKEEQYQYAEKLLKATNCLTRDKERGKIFADLAKMYEELEDYEDAATKAEECKKKAKKYKKLAKEAKEENPKVPGEEEGKTKPTGKIILGIIGIVIIAGIAGVIYLTTASGRYFRADFYQKTGDYEKSYKMFHNLKNYKDCLERSDESRQLLAKELLKEGKASKDVKKVEEAIDVLRKMENPKNGYALLTKAETQEINAKDIGGNVIYGEAHWIIADKDGDKVLLVKSMPINGIAYNTNGGPTNWKKSSMRKYLNGEYYDEIFFAEEMKAQIVTTKIETRTILGNTIKTKDNVFLLNQEQAEKYVEPLSNYKRDFWLIDQGNSPAKAKYSSYGVVMEEGYNVANTNIFTRPAVWVKTK